MAQEKKKHAIVIGGSPARLLAARVLSDHYEQVTIIERDAGQALASYARLIAGSNACLQ